MKKHLIYRSMFYLLLGALTASCSKMDATYKPFVVPNGISYIGKADSVHVYSGRNRVKITWLRGTDPKATGAVIYWNNKADSIAFPLTAEDPNDTVSIIIDDLPEGSYTFNIYTLDNTGHTSIRVDVLGTSYDSLYESALLIRPVDSVTAGGRDATIKWLTADQTSIGSELDYTDSTGKKHHLIVSSDSVTTVLKDYKFGTFFTYRTLYKPDSLAIDTFYTPFDSMLVEPPPPPPAENVNLALHKTIADKSSDGSKGRATELLDGDQSTFWQPLSADRRDDSKVWVVIDLGEAAAFNELTQYWTTGSGHIDAYYILYSADNSVWDTAYKSASGPDAGDNKATFPTVTARYVKLVLHFADDGNVNIAEVGIYNDPSVSPPKNLALGRPVTNSSGGSQPGSNTVDGDNDTYWQPYKADRTDDGKVSVTIDLGSSMTFDELDQYWTHGNSHIKSYTVFYSDDNSTWKTAYQSDSGPDAGANTATFTPVTGRYVKLELDFDTDGNVNIGEVEIWNR